MTWEIVVGIIALIGVFGTVAGWTSKLTKAITTLQDATVTLNNTIEKLEKQSMDVHREFDRKLDNHEERIIILEHKN